MSRCSMLLSLALIATAFPPPAAAQTGGAYDLRWSGAGAGGVTFALGGAYRLGGTVAQYATGPVAGGTYTIAGGLWVPEFVPSVGVPGGAGSAPAVFATRIDGANPFQTSASLRFDLPGPCHVSISLYGVDGRLVRTLVDAPFGAGRHAAYWDGMDRGGHTASPGVYFARVDAGDSRVTLRLVRLN